MMMTKDLQIFHMFRNQQFLAKVTHIAFINSKI